MIDMKYIVVTGGVLSGLGKGITASSIGLLLKRCGYKVTSVKIDPYLNIDAGTMNPIEHGEVYVLDDGGEVDLDLGNYERYLDVVLRRDHNITTGKVYQSVIEKERKGEFLGKTVQIIPHITNEIKRRIRQVGMDDGADITLVELGGTIGDIESAPYVEAVRQLRSEEGRDNLMIFHTTLVPVMGVVGEQKTKPTQHSVKELMAAGVHPDSIVCRCEEPLVDDVRAKISMFCDIKPEAVLSAHDVGDVYQVPLLLHSQNVTTFVQETLGLEIKEPDLATWEKFVEKNQNLKTEVNIALVGKYSQLKDSYLSHLKALHHAGVEVGVKPNVIWVDTPELKDENFDEKLAKMLDDIKASDAVLVPGGFGIRGIEGKKLALKYARENDVPALGICLGLQVMAIEYAWNVMGLEGASSSEFDDDSPHPVVDLLPEQRGVEDKGATMRLGAQPTLIKEGTMAFDLYGSTEISERHRHRFEINPEYIDKFEAAGFMFSGRSPDGIKMEIAELGDHPFYMGVQYHPEFKSRPSRPAPLFLGLVRAAAKYHAERE